MDRLIKGWSQIDIARTLDREQAHLQIYSALHERYRQPQNYKESAVLVCIYKKEDIAHTLLIRRNNKGRHANQIAFPGGALEPEDCDLRQTALREFEEEVGSPGGEILSPLSPIYIPVSQYRLSPYVSVLRTASPRFTPQESEVEALIPISIKSITELQLSTRTVDSYRGELTVRGYAYQDIFIWGATAMIIAEFKILCEIALRK